MAALKGSRTEENLKAAFAGESQANRRYLYFANKEDLFKAVIRETIVPLLSDFQRSIEGVDDPAPQVLTHSPPSHSWQAPQVLTHSPESVSHSRQEPSAHPPW